MFHVEADEGETVRIIVPAFPFLLYRLTYPATLDCRRQGQNQGLPGFRCGGPEDHLCRKDLARHIVCGTAQHQGKGLSGRDGF